MQEQDKGLSVQFFLHPQENPRKSKEAGRPIFDEIEMVSIAAPGNTKSEVVAFASSEHYDSNVQKQWTYAERFPEHYDAFKRGLDSQVQGTPLSEVGFLTIAQKAELKAKKIVTVEQLAAMADRDIKKMGIGFREHVDAAKAYLDVSSGTSELAKEMEELRRQIAELKGGQERSTEETGSQFAAMEEEDLRNMLQDAGVQVDGRWKKARLVKEADTLHSKAVEAA